MICSTETEIYNEVDLRLIYPIIFIMMITKKSNIYQINEINNGFINNYMLDIQNLSIIIFDWYFSILLIGILLTSCIIGILDKVGSSRLE